MKKTTENTALHILGTQFLSLYAQFLGLTDLSFWCFLILFKLYSNTSLSIAHQNATVFGHLMLNAFLKILCSDLAEKKLAWLRGKGLPLTCQ